jgi:hypothetical protein
MTVPGCDVRRAIPKTGEQGGGQIKKRGPVNPGLASENH